MRNFLRLSIVLLIALSLFSCEKENGGNGKTKTDLLCAHEWVFSDLTTDSEDAFVGLAVALVKAFMEGAVYDFNAAGTYTLTAFEETGTGTWEFSADETYLIQDKGTAEEIENRIVTLTDTQLKLEAEEEDQDLGTYTLIYTWVKQ